MKKKSVTVQLSDDDLQALADKSRETDHSISSLIREAVKNWLRENRIPEQRSEPIEFKLKPKEK